MTELINGRTPEEIKAGLKACTTGKTPGYGCNAHCPYLNVPNCWLSVKADALALIEHLEAKVPRWISVKERLPEQGSDVLIRIERDPEVVYYAAAIRNECSRLFDCWDTNDEDFNCGFGHPRVTHWMYITEPPKEENV